MARIILVTALMFVLAACGERAAEEYDISPDYEDALTQDVDVDVDEQDEQDEQTVDTQDDEISTDEPEEIPFALEQLTQSELELLPAWLLAGLEMYFSGADAQSNDDTVEIARRMAAVGFGFGDAWFVPGLISEIDADTLREDAETVALAFVRFISQSQTIDLRDFARKHGSSRYTDDAITATAALWHDFTGGTDASNDALGFAIRYQRGRVQHVDGSPQSPFGIVLAVHGNYATYYFGHRADDVPEQWTTDMLEHYIAIGEESIRFVADWLGHQPNRRFAVYFIHIDDITGGGYMDGIMTNFQHILDPPFVMAHEAVHGLLSAAGIRNNFPVVNVPWSGGYMTIPFFEEGMCIMLELLFEIETQNERFAIEAAAKRMGYWHVDTPGDFGGRQTRLTLDDALAYVNNRAIAMLDYYYDPNNAARFGTRYTVLNMWHTSASFMFYLYTERGTRDDLLRAYQNINLMYEIYGADMDGMIQSWLRWLDGWR